MNKKHLASILGVLVLIGTIVFLTTLISPRELVEFVGEENTYLLAFVLALFGGVSTVTSSSFYALMGALALTELNPVILALMFGSGLFLGDLIFFYLGKKVRENLSEKLDAKLNKLTDKLKNKPRYWVWIFVFIYAGFTPFPGDILMLLLASLRYKFKEFALPLFAGSFVLGMVIWWLANTGSDLLKFLL